MGSETPVGCGCPPTAPAVPGTGGVHHVFLTVNDLNRSRAFYTSLMPRLGYPGIWEAEGAPVVGWLHAGGAGRRADRGCERPFRGEGDITFEVGRSPLCLRPGRGRQWPRGLAGGGTAAGRERGERGSRPPTLTPQ